MTLLEASRYPAIIPMSLFSGYVIPYRQIWSIWKPIYYASPLQWGMTLLEASRYQGLIFDDCDPDEPNRRCYATGEEVLEAQSTDLARTLGVSGMLLLCLAYVGLFLLLNLRLIRTRVLDGRV